MAAYVISEVEILDPTLIETYRALAQPAIDKFGGCYIARGAPEVIEHDLPPRAGAGTGAPPRLVILEFPSLEQARAWYRSPEYARALEVRKKALRRRLVFLDGTV